MPLPGGRGGGRSARDPRVESAPVDHPRPGILGGRETWEYLFNAADRTEGIARDNLAALADIADLLEQIRDIQQRRLEIATGEKASEVKAP